VNSGKKTVEKKEQSMVVSLEVHSVEWMVSRSVGQLVDSKE
jgi:hypothetical protein